MQYEIDFNNMKFYFYLKYTESEINIKGKEENNLNEIFEASFTLSALTKMNNIFKLLNTTKECCDFLIKIIKNKKLKINKESNKLIIILIIKNFITENEEEVKMALTPKILDTNEIIGNYSIIIKELKNEISILKKENNNSKNENISLKNEISTLQKEISNLNNEYKSFKDNINNIIDERIKSYKEKEKEKEEKIEKEIFYDVNNSCILTTSEEKLYFQNLIECKNLTLLYRATTHGSNAEDFHKFCDKKGATIIIFKNGKNRKFGGYLSENWENSGDWKKDDNVFVFSIDLKKKYKIKKDKDSYYCQKKFGPKFNGLGIDYSGNILEAGKFAEDNLTEYYEVNEGYQQYEISGGQSISCKEVEVYKVEL